MENLWVYIHPFCGDQKPVQSGHTRVDLIIWPFERCSSKMQVHQRMGVDPVRELSHLLCSFAAAWSLARESNGIPFPTNAPGPFPPSHNHIQLIPKFCSLLTIIRPINWRKKPYRPKTVRYKRATPTKARGRAGRKDSRPKITGNNKEQMEIK